MGCFGCDECSFLNSSKEKGIFEIHITTNNSNIKNVLEIGKKEKIKFVNIELGEGNHHLMTSQKFSGSYEDMLSETNRIIKVFKDNNLNINRIKIESFPDLNLPFVYYETHVQLILPKISFNVVKNKLNFYLEDWHFSKNSFKNFEDYFVYMITHRNYNKEFSKIDDKIINICGVLDMLQIKYEKIIKEQCIYDSNENLDEIWMKRKLNGFIQTSYNCAV